MMPEDNAIDAVLATPARPDTGMSWIPDGESVIGSDDHYPEEKPCRRVSVRGFWIDKHPVTNAEFARFIDATGYVTTAERKPDQAAYPGVDPSMLVAGSLVFVKPAHRVPLDDLRRWWRYIPGACWRNPEGPGSSLDGRESHPVVHVTHEDAAGFARWCGKALPTEMEWEYAARGGLDNATYTWGDDPAPDGRMMANTWQGEFPWQNLNEDGYERTSPVDAFPPNCYGLFDMAGNVWEWTDDLYAIPLAPAPRQCCGAGVAVADMTDITSGIPRYVVKGGSHLCAPNYCLRYRPAARQGESADTSSSHIGFRCVIRGKVPHA